MGVGIGLEWKQQLWACVVQQTAMSLGQQILMAYMQLANEYKNVVSFRMDAYKALEQMAEAR